LFNFIVFSTSTKKFYIDPITGRNQLSIRGYTDKSGEGLTHLLVGGNINMQFNIYKGIWLTSSFYHGFTSIYEEKEQTAGKSKYRTIQLGLRYSL
jgi:hypothetical protein